MPNLKSSIKNLRKSQRLAKQNAVVRDELHSLRRGFRIAVSTGKAKELAEMTRDLTKKIDKAARAHIISPNKASRLKSRMMKKVNALAK